MNRHPDGAGLDPDTYSYLRVVDGSVDKCIEITKRLLNLSQLPSQSTQLVSLSVIAPEVISLLRYEAEQIGVDMALDLGTADLRILATDSDMRMLVLNLTQNAFHAMPSGGRFVLKGRIEGGNVAIEARDTGGGINPAVLPRIFDPFFSKRADGVEGTGLGLTICKAIVTRHGGTIEAGTEAGRGATFKVTLPFAGEACAGGGGCFGGALMNEGHAPHPVPLPMGEGDAATVVQAFPLPWGEGQGEGRVPRQLCTPFSNSVEFV